MEIPPRLSGNQAFLLAVAVACVMLATCPVTQGQSPSANSMNHYGYFDVVYEKSSQSNVVEISLTYDEFNRNYISYKSRGYFLLHFDSYVHPSLTILYNCIFKRGGTAVERDDKFGIHLTYAQFKPLQDSYWAQGYRIKFLSPYLVSGEVRYSVVWRKTGQNENYLFGWTYTDYRQWYDANWPKGWRLSVIKTVMFPEGLRYFVVFNPGTHNEIQLYGWAQADVATKTAQLAASNYRVALLESYWDAPSNSPRYVVVYRNIILQEKLLYQSPYWDFVNANRADYTWNPIYISS